MELKFRAWKKNFKEYYEIIGINFETKDVYLSGYGLADSSEVILEQFTGMKDKNGKEIYVGDIVEVNHPFKERVHIGEVIFEGYRFNIKDFYFTHFNYPSEAFSEGTLYMKVIGNIHEKEED